MSTTEASRSADICRRAYQRAVDLGAPDCYLEMLRQTIMWFEMQAAGATMHRVASA